MTNKAGVQPEILSSMAFLPARGEVIEPLYVRKGVWWHECEPAQGVYDFSIPDQWLYHSNAPGHNWILSVKNAPIWARKRPLIECSKPLNDYYDAYCDFVIALLERYQDLIWGIEFWNEPDANRFPPKYLMRHLGCWGNTELDGKRYGKFVGHVYERLKPNYQDIEFLAGALTNPSADFAKGFITKAAGRFDVLTYHSYPRYYKHNWNRPIRASNILFGLAPDKPQMITETSLLSFGPGGAAFEADQAAYFNHLLNNLDFNRVLAFIWFTLGNNGWGNSDLIYNNVRKPVYFEWENFINE